MFSIARKIAIILVVSLPRTAIAMPSIRWPVRPYLFSNSIRGSR